MTGRPDDPPTFCGACDQRHGDRHVVRHRRAGGTAGSATRTGQGCVVDTSLFESAVFWVEGPLNSYLVDRQGAAAPRHWRQP